ncbi:CHASE3 domain-containing protein, partial [Pseudomonas otitidis]
LLFADEGADVLIGTPRFDQRIGHLQPARLGSLDSRQSVECESSLRGFLLSGDEAFLEGYQETAPRLLGGL